MGLIMLPFIACVILFPFIVAFFIYQNHKSKERAKDLEARWNVENSYSRMYRRAFEQGRRLTPKEEEELKKTAIRIHGKGRVRDF